MPGKILLSLCNTAELHVFLASPFIKYDSLTRVLTEIPLGIKQLTVVTRWIPSEIAAGVSDLEIFDLLKARPNTRLLLHPCLHAKYYRIDNRCLIGSANLTGKALGWSYSPNIELLVEIDPNGEQVKHLEPLLNSQAIEATESIRTAIKQQVDELKPVFNMEDIQVNAPSIEVWLPLCNKPEYLYKIYSKQDTSGLLKSAVDAGYKDLERISPIPGMDEEAFSKYVAAIFESTPAAQEINRLTLTSTISTEDATGVIAQYREQISAPDYDAHMHWEIFKAWLLHYFPKRYRTRAAVEVLEQAKELG